MIRPLHRAARVLLQALLPHDIRDAAIGDLEDEMAERMAAGVPPRAVLVWSLRQTIGSLPAAARLRLAARRRSRRSRKEHGSMIGIWHDLRYALRFLRRSPLLTCAVVGTLALGIGATTAIFSVVYASLLRELPYREPDRIVRIYETFRGNQFSRGVANPANYDFWERHAGSFAHITAMQRGGATLTGAGEPVRVNVQSVLPAFFDVIGIAPAIGRPLAAADGEATVRPVLLSHELWTTRYGADPAIVGRMVTLDETTRPIAGVMPSGFRFPSETDVWQVLVVPGEARTNSRSWYLGVVARLHAGVSVAQAQAEMNALADQLRAQAPGRQKDRGVYVVPLHEDLVYRVADGLKLLQGSALLVLLIALANVANLLLAHGTSRTREFGVRAAIGAGRARIVRQLLTEGLLLGIVGAAGGAILAVWGVRALVAVSPLRLPEGMAPAVDLPVLLFALGTGVLASIVFGAAPALIAARTDVASPMKGSGGTSASGTRVGAGRLRTLLVVGETALAVMLLVGAGLLIRSFTQLMSQDVGFAVDRLVTAETTLPASRYDTPEKRAAFWSALFERLEGLPGVTAAGGSTAVPFSRWEWQTDFTLIGHEPALNEAAGIRTVHPGYFTALGIPVLQGRTFTDEDTAGSERTLVVNEAFAREYLPGVDPIGQRVRFTRESGPPFQIIGVTGSTRHVRLDGLAQPEMYRSVWQHPVSTLVLAVRTAGAPRAVTSLIRSAVQDLDRDLPVENLRTMEEMIARTVAERRFYLALMGAFAALALLLAVTGIYGVISYTVGQRTREIGIRMALGAAPRQVQHLVLRSALLLVVSGLVAGLLGARFASQLLRSLLFGVTANDPVTTAVTIAIIVALSLAAAYVPARRAMQMSPVAALRRE